MSNKHPQKTASFLTGGDIAPDRNSAKGMFGRPGKLFRDADFSFANLENALSTRGELMKGKATKHRGHPSLVAGLVDAGFDAVGIANNHLLDFGVPSLEETMVTLRRARIPFTGAGLDLEEAMSPVVIERGGLIIGLLAYSSVLPQGHAADSGEPGVNPLRVKTSYTPLRNLDEYPASEPIIHSWAVTEDLARMKRDIRNLKRRTDLVFVYQHWGASMRHEVHEHQREIGQAAIDAGACAVFGGHQHVLSAIEFYKGQPIVHCTGNLIFDEVEPFFTEATLQTFLLGGKMGEKGLSDLHLIPCRCGVGGAPRLLSPKRGEGREIVDMMRKLSAPYGTELSVKDGEVAVSPLG
ncbi:MAG: CapA family protein [Nitrospinae bacterium]|nr:CapA family protein [Nitrospinota bacterium]